MQDTNLQNDVLIGIFGTTSTAQYIVLFFFILIGVTISIRLGAKKRDKTSENTPYHFSWAFFTIDNALRAIGSICIAFLFIRFGEDLSGRALTPWAAVLLGAGFDQAIQVLKDARCAWRNKIKEKLQGKEQ